MEAIDSRKRQSVRSSAVPRNSQKFPRSGNFYRASRSQKSVPKSFSFWELLDDGGTARNPRAATPAGAGGAMRRPGNFWTHLQTTKIRRQLCGRCRRMTWAGLDEGLPVQVDLHPISQTDEIEALVAGKATYALLPGRTLALRDVDRISGGLVGQGIYAQHACTTLGASS